MPKPRPPKAKRQARQRAILLTTPEGRIQFADPVARRWLKQFFSRPARAGLLPRKVCGWLAENEQPKAPKSLVAKQGKARLYLKRQNLYTPHLIGLLLEKIKGSDKERPRRHHSLTPRECEVLSWLARGKSNAEIAAILGIRSATVGKHLERIYPKLGVENRTAAISFASVDSTERCSQ